MIETVIISLLQSFTELQGGGSACDRIGKEYISVFLVCDDGGNVNDSCVSPTHTKQSQNDVYEEGNPATSGDTP